MGNDNIINDTVSGDELEEDRHMKQNLLIKPSRVDVHLLPTRSYRNSTMLFAIQEMEANWMP